MDGGNPMTAMVMSFMPPECKKEVQAIQEEATKTYHWLKDKKCAECKDKGGVKGSSVMLMEEAAKIATNAYIDWLATKDLDIDKICPQKFRRKEIWEFYGKWKPPCIMDTKEFTQIQDLCKSTEKDFPKTQKCVEDKGTAVFKERATPPPMDCVSKALKKCNKKDLGEYKDHFMVKMRADPNVHKGKNAWVMTNSYFKNGCTGKI